MEEPSALLLDPKRFAVHDGPGIRTTFFLKGCPLHCLWCHNPESISPKPQTAFYEHKCINCGECGKICPSNAHVFTEKHRFCVERCTACGACESACLGLAMKTYGQRKTVSDCLSIALEDKDFYENSNGGVTLSGGEPLYQPEFTLAFLGELKKHGIHTALDTSAFAAKNLFERALPVTDIFLVDYKHDDPVKHQQLTGQRNEIIKDNLKFLSESGANIEIRIPLVPGCNSSDENLHNTGKFLGSLRIGGVKLLPYHSLARTKYKSLEMTDTMPDVPAPTDTEMEHAKAILRKYGLKIL